MKKTTKTSSTKSTTKAAATNTKKATLEQMKMEAANAVGVNLKPGYNGHLTSREAGAVGGQMVKKMVEAYEKNK